MIKGLIPQLAERGKIKIGEKGELKTSSGGKQFALPKKLDHFVVTTMRRDQAGRLMPDTELMRRLAPDGQKITEIPVRLMYDDIDLNFQSRYACYKGNRCWCSGDGETAQRLKGENAYEAVACPCQRQDPLYAGQDRCKVLGTLQCLVEGVDRVGGVWKFRTTSWNTTNAILSSLHFIKTITGGALARIPLWLVMDPKTVTVPITGQNMVVYVVRIEYRGTEQELADLGYEIAKQRAEHKIRMDKIEEAARAALVLPQLEAPEEQADTAQEFFPEAVGEPEPELAGRPLPKEEDHRTDAVKYMAEGLNPAPAWIPEEEVELGSWRAEDNLELEAQVTTVLGPDDVPELTEEFFQKAEMRLPEEPTEPTCPKCNKQHPGPQLLCQKCLDDIKPKTPAAKRKSTRQAMEEAKQVFEGAKEAKDQGGLF